MVPSARFSMNRPDDFRYSTFSFGPGAFIMPELCPMEFFSLIEEIPGMLFLVMFEIASFNFFAFCSSIDFCCSKNEFFAICLFG